MLQSISAAHKMNQMHCAAISVTLQSSQKIDSRRRLRVQSFTLQMKILPLSRPEVLPGSSPTRNSPSKTIYRRTVKQHFMEPVPQHQLTQPCPVIWATFMFSSGTLETEMPSARDFSNKDIGTVIQLWLDSCSSFPMMVKVCACKGWHV